MSSVGPELPPHLLAKRKRSIDDESEELGPPAVIQPGSPAGADKRRRVLGPSLPPAPLNQRPQEAAEDSDSSSDDDDYGPALPSAEGSAVCTRLLYYLRH